MLVPTRILTPVAVLAAILGSYADDRDGPRRPDAKGGYHRSHADAEDDQQGSESTVVQSLFRFPASKLGPEFDELLQIWY